MVVEIAAGLLFGSMALLADGLHMGSHASALGIAWFAYVYARRHAHDDRFSFGTGKVNALAGFSSALVLLVVALLMTWESVERLLHPVSIAFNQALVVAVLGLVINGLSMLILGHDEAHDHEDDADEDHHHHHDHNLRAAYFHVLADAMTSVLAIAALLAGKYVGATWLDPAMGIVGALLVGKWAFGLIRTTSSILLDHQASATLRRQIVANLTENGDQVVDLHLWVVAPGALGLIVAIASRHPKTPAEYRAMLPADDSLRHVTIEVWPRTGQ